jgi:hypothetical protein
MIAVLWSDFLTSKRFMTPVLSLAGLSNGFSLRRLDGGLLRDR